MNNFLKITAWMMGWAIAVTVYAQQPQNPYANQRLKYGSTTAKQRSAPVVSPTPASTPAPVSATQVKDPWRIIDGKTNHVVIADGWRWFYGDIISVTKEGILIRNENDEGKVWFIAGFPYAVADGDHISDRNNMAAWPDGMFHYENALGAAKTVRKMTYGKRTAAPAEFVAAEEKRLRYQAEQEQAAKEEAIAYAAKVASDKKSMADQASFKFHTEQAAAGNAGSMYRLGQLYLAGSGCDANTNQAKLWFKKAADAGNADAAAALKSLE